MKNMYICFMNLTEMDKKKLNMLCDKHKVKELYLFGSVLTEEFNELSDIDLLVQFYKVDLLEYFDNYMGLKEELEKLYKRSVDLVEDHAIRNPIFRIIIERDKQLIYERKSTKIIIGHQVGN